MRRGRLAPPWPPELFLRGRGHSGIIPHPRISQIYASLHLRYRWCRVLPGQGHRRRVPGGDSRIAWSHRHPPQAGPLHQRRSGHHEPVPARRGVRHRGRRRNRPGSGPLRALHPRQDGQAQQLHHRPDLRVGDQEGTARRVPGQDGAGHPPHHRRDQGLHQAWRRGRRRGHHRDRRHGRRHRIPAVPGSHPPDGHRGRQAGLLLHPPDPAALHSHRRRAEDQADPAFGQGTAGDRHPAGRVAVPGRPPYPGRGTAQDRPVLQRHAGSGDRGPGRGFHLQDPGHAARPDAGRDRLPQAGAAGQGGRPVGVEAAD
jgi:hypothetical protein